MKFITDLCSLKPIVQQFHCYSGLSTCYCSLMKLDSWVCIENSIGDVFKKFHINITVAMLLQKFHLGERGLS
jgi:hypothetical protein